MLSNNIILIGMPGSGKSTVGRVIAAQYEMDFIDVDDLIEKNANMPIQSIVDDRGLEQFGELEESVLCNIACDNTVVSTGGSAVYSHRGMQHLGKLGGRLYLEISLETLMARVTNESSRGLYRKPGQSLSDLYHERHTLYPTYADLTFDNDGCFDDAQRQRLFTLLSEFFGISRG